MALILHYRLQFLSSKSTIVVTSSIHLTVFCLNNYPELLPLIHVELQPPLCPVLLFQLPSKEGRHLNCICLVQIVSEIVQKTSQEEHIIIIYRSTPISKRHWTQLFCADFQSKKSDNPTALLIYKESILTTVSRSRIYLLRIGSFIFIQWVTPRTKMWVFR